MDTRTHGWFTSHKTSAVKHLVRYSMQNSPYYNGLFRLEKLSIFEYLAKKTVHKINPLGLSKTGVTLPPHKSFTVALACAVGPKTVN